MYWLEKVITLILIVALSSCASFRKLGEDLKFLEETSVISVRLDNIPQSKKTYGITIEWDKEEQKVKSADFTTVSSMGIFGFFVPGNDEHYVAAYTDANNNQRYDEGEPSWIHSGADGQPAPVAIDAKEDKARLTGHLSRKTIIPSHILKAAREFRGVKSVAEVARSWQIPVDLGTIADLDEARFSSERGSKGYWEPASYPIETGIGIFFLEKYDPNRIPILFVYGAAGSPQDWRTFFNKLDRKKYQAWFAHYPTGRRLDELGTAINTATTILQNHYGFQRLHVVAHSMGGLVSRDFILKNHDDGNRYIKKYVTISTPWGGQEFAAMGVKRAPSVIPSWHDMVVGSPFQKGILKRRLLGKVDYLLIYSHKSKRSMTLPAENDGTVSVSSQLHPFAKLDAKDELGFAEDHVSILSNDEVIKRVFQHLSRE